MNIQELEGRDMALLLALQLLIARLPVEERGAHAQALNRDAAEYLKQEKPTAEFVSGFHGLLRELG